jgi:hypothetical protein
MAFQRSAESHGAFVGTHHFTRLPARARAGNAKARLQTKIQPLPHPYSFASPARSGFWSEDIGHPMECIRRRSEGFHIGQPVGHLVVPFPASP